MQTSLLSNEQKENDYSSILRYVIMICGTVLLHDGLLTEDVVKREVSVGK